MRVAIDVRPLMKGGKASALRSLVQALGALDDGPEEYVLAVSGGSKEDWGLPLAPNQRLVVPPSSPAPSRARTLRHRVGRWFSEPCRKAPAVSVSNGFYESLGCDVVHFPSSRFTLCALPTVYNPHDLQHLHYPQFFTPQDIAKREATLPLACRLSNTVIVNSQWVKDDVVRQYAVSVEKIQVIPEAPATQFVGAVSRADREHVRARYGLNNGFVFYPSVVWPHKNHIRLLDAIAYLRHRSGKRVFLVCTGSPRDPFGSVIEQRVRDLSLDDQVRFLGFVPQEDLPGLYQLAGCLILPTLFEANSLPMFEAWREGTPVISSNVTALPEQAGGAAFLFDPLDTVAIADAVARVLTDQGLADDLRGRGYRRLQDFDWIRTGRAYRAVYRRAAGQRLSEEDEALLGWDWMRYPAKEPMSARP